MYEHVAEAFVPVPHAECVAEKVCARSGDYCRSIGTRGPDTLLDFGDARAILRPTNEGLYFRVEAQGYVTFCGIRTLLQGSLSAITMFPGEAVEWHPVGGVPLA
ncbi:SMa0974 family conjugal transfer regulator [Sinorhizobium meliloti]|uniref:SMa0974 family conjugal transfer regulator n=1 Tax=Rhizobium meliloti TaxID=382 RepID=UPI003F17B8DE